MTRWIHLGALIGLAIATQAQAQQAPPAQNTQAPTSQNSPTSIGPDPFRAHDANVSPSERAEEGAEPAPGRNDATGDGKERQKMAEQAQRRCAVGKDGKPVPARQGEVCAPAAPPKP